MKVGSWQFYALTFFVVALIFIVCHYWDKYDKYKIKKPRNRSQQ